MSSTNNPYLQIRQLAAESGIVIAGLWDRGDFEQAAGRRLTDDEFLRVRGTNPYSNFEYDDLLLEREWELVNGALADAGLPHGNELDS